LLNPVTLRRFLKIHEVFHPALPDWIEVEAQLSRSVSTKQQYGLSNESQTIRQSAKVMSKAKDNCHHVVLPANKAG
jgi:hypothetical protein